MATTFSYREGSLEPGETDVVQEFPLKLTVNGRELATLVCSPHDLDVLVAGFLRLQGFVHTADDFLVLSVCEDFGVAQVRVRGAIPERLRPVLTSGCGTGITFTLDPGRRDGAGRAGGRSAPRRRYRPSAVFALMEQLARAAENYRQHGGIHSAAVGRGGAMLLFAEDLGRHNTLDRIAGEALLEGIDLAGTMLVTSGRVSTEMAAKAALLDVGLIASRTSPTDMAVRMCEEAGIVLVGYVRGGRFTVYANADGLDVEARAPAAQGA
jgi:FdhD protein